MKRRIHTQNCIPVDDEMLKAIVSRTDSDDSKMFEEFLTELIAKKTGSVKKPRLNEIAKCAGLGRQQLYRFPVNRKNLIRIAMAYDLTLKETSELFRRCGAYLNIRKERDREYILTKAGNDEDLPEYISRESREDCLLRLINDHDYDGRLYGERFSEIMNGFKEKADSGSEVSELLMELALIIHREGSEFGWIVLEKKDPLMSSKNETERVTVFEIACVLGFDPEETEQLFRSYGYTLCPEYIRFDAYAVWLMSRGYSRADIGYLYKAVCSNRDESKNGVWNFKQPELKEVEKILGIKRDYDKEDYVKMFAYEMDPDEDPGLYV